MRAAASIADVGPAAVLVTAIVGVEMPARGLIKGLFCTKGRLAVEAVNSVTHERDPWTYLWLLYSDIREGDWAWYTCCSGAWGVNLSKTIILCIKNF